MWEGVESWDKDPRKSLHVGDLPLGEVRLKKSGGTGGHNGLESIAQHIGAGFGRIRIGISHPRGTPIGVSDYVLQPFTPEERPVAEQAIALLAQHIGACLSLFVAEPFANRKFIARKEDDTLAAFL